MKIELNIKGRRHFGCIAYLMRTKNQLKCGILEILIHTFWQTGYMSIDWWCNLCNKIVTLSVMAVVILKYTPICLHSNKISIGVFCCYLWSAMISD